MKNVNDLEGNIVVKQNTAAWKNVGNKNIKLHSHGTKLTFDLEMY